MSLLMAHTFFFFFALFDKTSIRQNQRVKNLNHRIVESKNRRMVAVGRDLKDH